MQQVGDFCKKVIGNDLDPNTLPDELRAKQNRKRSELDDLLPIDTSESTDE